MRVMGRDLLVGDLIVGFLGEGDDENDMQDDGTRWLILNAKNSTHHGTEFFTILTENGERFRIGYEWHSGYEVIRRVSRLADHG